MHEQAQNKTNSHSKWPMDCSDLPTLLYPAIHPEQAGKPLILPTTDQVRLTEPWASGVSVSQTEHLSAISSSSQDLLKDISSEETNPLAVPTGNVTKHSITE